MPIPGDPLPISPASWTEIKTGRPTDQFYQYIFKLDSFVGTNINQLIAQVTQLLGPLRPMVLLNTLTASSSSSLDDTTSITSAYDQYMIEVSNLVPATNAVALLMRVQVSATFQSTGYNNYFQAAGATENNTTGIQITGTGVLITTISNLSTYGCSANLFLHGPNGSNRKFVNGSSTVLASDGVTLAGGLISGSYTAGTGAVTGLRFLVSSGNIASGTVRIYGIKTS